MGRVMQRARGGRGGRCWGMVGGRGGGRGVDGAYTFSQYSKRSPGRGRSWRWVSVFFSNRDAPHEPALVEANVGDAGVVGECFGAGGGEGGVQPVHPADPFGQLLLLPRPGQ